MEAIALSLNIVYIARSTNSAIKIRIFVKVENSIGKPYVNIRVIKATMKIINMYDPIITINIAMNNLKYILNPISLIIKKISLKSNALIIELFFIIFTELILHRNIPIKSNIKSIKNNWNVNVSYNGNSHINAIIAGRKYMKVTINSFIPFIRNFRLSFIGDIFSEIFIVPFKLSFIIWYEYPSIRSNGMINIQNKQINIGILSMTSLMNSLWVIYTGIMILIMYNTLSIIIDFLLLFVYSVASFKMSKIILNYLLNLK